MTINERLKKALEVSGHTQKELSEALGVPKSTVNSWFKLGRDIPPDQIIPICEFCDISVDYALRGEGEPVGPGSFTLEEIALINLYRDKRDGTHTIDANISDFFPEIEKEPAPVLSGRAQALVGYFEVLDDYDKGLVIGYAKGLSDATAKKDRQTSGPAADTKAV